jgi:CheY-like chemotaxis protein
MLTSLGYEAVVTSRSPKALEIFRQNPARFDVVITDQVMPQMTGAELIKELQVIRPDIPIVLCTGFDEKFPREQAEAIGVREFVMKPIVRHDLARAIRRAISEPGAPPVADADLPPEGPEAPGNPPPDSTSVPAGST